MQYPLAEKIGEPNLLVGREQEFRKFGKWLANILQEKLVILSEANVIDRGVSDIQFRGLSRHQISPKRRNDILLEQVCNLLRNV